MSKISARDIQVLVAAMIACLGFKLLVWMPYAIIDSLDIIDSQTITDSQPIITVGGFILGGVLLLLGILIFAGNIRALRWVQVFLWLWLVLNAGVIGFDIFEIGSGQTSYIRLNDGILGFLCSLALLSMIAWSRSMRFRYTDPGTADILLNVRRPGFMRKISARDIEVFVAGVIAYFGFFGFAEAADLRDTHAKAIQVAFMFIYGGVFLLLGILIFVGSMRALRCVQVILWIMLAVNALRIQALTHWKLGSVPSFDIPKESLMPLYMHIASVLTYSALLWLIACSRSKRFSESVTTSPTNGKVCP